MAVAAAAVRAAGAERVAIIDWDVHHGNGTDQIFRGHQEVMLFSLFEQGLYPLDSGKKTEGDGHYIALPGGSGGADFNPFVRRIFKHAYVT